MSVEALIKEAASTGRLSGLTVWPCSAGWQCNVQRKTVDGAEGWCCVTDTDPVAGLTRALTGAFTSVNPLPARTPPDTEGDIFG